LRYRCRVMGAGNKAQNQEQTKWRERLKRIITRKKHQTINKRKTDY